MIDPLPLVVPLTEVYRGDLVESRHRGAVVLADSTGRTTHWVGDRAFRTFWRSSAKPLQALPAIVTGAADHFGLEERHIAIMCGSHVGKDYHVAVVREILERAGVPESALRCDVLGRPLTRHGCSGKHAGMLATAAHLGETLDGYTEPRHPVQVRIRETMATMASLAPDAVALASDGCSVPTFAMTLTQMAVAFGRLVDPTSLPPRLADACRRIVAAMWSHPELLSGAPGDTQDMTSALVALKPHALIAKSGAEALYTVAIAPGIVCERGVGLAVRSEDGGSVQRSCYLATVEALRQLNALDTSEIALLEPFLARTIRNVHGQIVGDARPCFTLNVADGRRPDAGMLS